jgi:phage tail sheath protein FI
VPRYGFCIMGARTLAYGMPSRYIAIRRTLMYVESLLKRGVQFALFQPNNNVLWNKISSIVTQQLSSLMQAGYFASQVASSAYWVRCDSTNNVPSSTSTGVVHIDVGVALAAPAEYVVINIGLFDATTNVSSTLT